MTEVLPSRTPDERAKATAAAIELLRGGEPVALPTETVYGLAADALKSDAAVKIFEAKERPRFDPLIIHLPDREWLERVARLHPDSRGLVEKLIGEFWPGPFT
ncbi:MAG: Sua5/YciO/YrdC/YwlC family protein, partial [Verrucomicrobiaceae bacterium]|nr:Sua5/YciO/YrdC/YwlC family protein [Verrucomicrobiaceae bacterium]